MVANVSELLRDRYVDPLRGEGAFGDQVVESLRGYLSHDRSIPQAAEALHVHVNTLRYRLARFEELTGRSLQATDTLVELAWVLYPEPTVS
jgi:putative transposase